MKNSATGLKVSEGSEDPERTLPPSDDPTTFDDLPDDCLPLILSRVLKADFSKVIL
jgi:hypothetical protein